MEYHSLDIPLTVPSNVLEGRMGKDASAEIERLQNELELREEYSLKLEKELYRYQQRYGLFREGGGKGELGERGEMREIETNIHLLSPLIVAYEEHLEELRETVREREKEMGELGEQCELLCERCEQQQDLIQKMHHNLMNSPKQSGEQNLMSHSGDGDGDLVEILRTKNNLMQKMNQKLTQEKQNLTILMQQLQKKINHQNLAPKEDDHLPMAAKFATLSAEIDVYKKKITQILKQMNAAESERDMWKEKYGTVLHEYMTEKEREDEERDRRVRRRGEEGRGEERRGEKSDYLSQSDYDDRRIFSIEEADEASPSSLKPKINTSIDKSANKSIPREIGDIGEMGEKSPTSSPSSLSPSQDIKINHHLKSTQKLLQDANHTVEQQYEFSEGLVQQLQDLQSKFELVSSQVEGASLKAEKWKQKCQEIEKTLENAQKNHFSSLSALRERLHQQEKSFLESKVSFRRNYEEQLSHLRKKIHDLEAERSFSRVSPS